ncbi:MAG: rod shape-determining protein MreD [Acidiferrobacteraceae bacterium]|jgi:rod shape-determining protein MreD
MTLNPVTRSYLVVASTFVVAMILAQVPVPNWAEGFRPDWVGLVLIYWCLATPNRVGIGTGWLVGMIQDVLYGSLLGQHALALTVIAYLAARLHLRIRVYPPWQQGLVALVLLSIGQLIVVWVRAIIGQSITGWAFWTPGLVSLFIWPWVFVILRDIRRRGQVK